MAGLNFDITGDNSNFLRKLEEARNGVRSTSKQIEESGMSIEQMFGRLAKGAAAFGAGFSAQQFISQVTKVRGEFQQLEVAFNTMLGSEQKANALMQQLVKTAATTPFDLQGVANGAKQLLAYGTAAEDVNGTLVRLGDIAAGLSIPLGDLVYLYGTTMTQGRLFTQDLRQFQGRGIPLADELAKQFGVTKDKVGELVTAGKVGFPEVQKAIEAMTNEGGKFGGLMEAQSKTITGQISNIEDSISTMFNNIGKNNEGLINNTLSGVSYLVENYEKIGNVLLEIVGVYGAYRTALMVTTALQALQASGIAALTVKEAVHYGWLVLTKKAQDALNLSMLKNPYVLAAVAVAGLAYGIYKLATAESDTEKAIRTTNESLEAQKKHYDDLKSKSSELSNVLTNESKSIEERFIAYRKLQRLMPDVFKDMDFETAKRLSNVDAIKLETDEILRQQLIGLKTKVVMLRQKIQGLENSIIRSDNTGGYTGALKEGLAAAKKELEIYQKALDDFEEAKKQSEEEAKTPTTQNKSYWEAQRKNAQEELDALADIEAAGAKGLALKQKIAEYDKRISIFSTNTSKQESSTENLRKEQEKLKSLQGKQSKDSIRQVKDLEFETAQAKISSMQSGSEKTIAQMNLDHQKEIETLKRNREDYLQKKIEAERAIFEADPSNKGQSFDSSTVSLSKDEKGMFNNLLESTIYQQGDELANYYKEILSKYQGYTEKRLAAQKKFQQERDALVNAGASKETLAEHDYQRDETYKSIDNEFAMREDSFKAWADNIADLSLEKLRELLVQAERELERSEFLNPKDPKLAEQRAKVTSLKNTISEKSTETNTSPSKRSQKDWQDLYNTLSKVEREFDEIGKAVGGTAGEIISAAGGIATSTLQMIDGITTLANGSSEAMAGTAQAASKSIQAVEKASVILAIIGAALQIATKIANMFGADYSNYNKAKENYENYVEVLDTVISKQKELMETMTGKAAVEASQKALELIEKQADAARILGKERLNAGASAGSHSIGVRIRKGMSSEGWNEAKKALGSAFYNNGIGDGRMTGLFDLSVEQLEKLQMEAPTFWAKLDGDVREYLEQIIACNEKTEEMKDLLNEALTQVSFDDVYSNFLDALSDMDASSEDFADNFEKYMQKAILNSMLIDNYKSRIDEWYKAFAKANDDNAGITEEEYKDLQNDWNNLISDALSERDKLKDLFGWTSNESTSQSSTTKGFQAMSQDTGNELNGRFTALQISNEEIKNSMLSMLTGVNLISTTTANNGITLTEIRNLAISSNSYLEDIARFTKPLLEVGGKLDRIENNTKGLATR